MLTKTNNLALILILAAMAATAMAASTTTVSIKPAAQVSGQSITLGDIATIGCGDSSLSERLNALVICPSPLPGKTRRISRQEIIIAMRRDGVYGDGTSLLCPSDLSVTRACSTVSGEALFEAVRAFILASNPLPGKVSPEAMRLPLNQVVPSGKPELSVRSMTAIRKGQNSLSVDIIIDGKVYRTVSVTVLVRVVASVPVAAQAIARSEQITTTNVTQREMDITYSPSDILIGEPQSGWQAQVPIQEGSILRKSWVQEPPVIHSGDAVRVIVSSGSVRISDKGVAVQDGRSGQRVKIRMLGDVREVLGTVSGPGEVQISIGGR